MELSKIFQKIISLECQLKMNDDSDSPSHCGLMLSDLPQDALLHICLFLEYNDLVTLSASCSHLRNIINVNCVWKRVVGGDITILGRLPEVGPSTSPSLPPLCRQRALCLRRAQLVNNVRNQCFSKQATDFTGFLYTLETTQQFITKTCTLDGNYLFGIDYEDKYTGNEVVKVFHLGDRLISTLTDFRPNTHTESYSVIFTCQVVGDKLVVRLDELFNVYRIELPALHFRHLHSINAQHGPSECEVILVGNLIFSKNDFIKVVRVWDIHTGQQFDDLSSKVAGLDLTVIGYSVQLDAVMFLSRGREMLQATHVFEYSTKSMVFTEFSITLDDIGTMLACAIGLLNVKYSTILVPRQDRHMSVYVYDRSQSVLVCEKEFEDINYSDVDGDYFIINNCLALKSLTEIKIIHLSNLEILWQIPLDIPASFTSINERPIIMYAECRYFNIANALHLIAVSTGICVSFWDFELRRKLFELPTSSTSICINDACTKLIFQVTDGCKRELCVWSFAGVDS